MSKLLVIIDLCRTSLSAFKFSYDRYYTVLGGWKARKSFPRRNMYGLKEQTPPVLQCALNFFSVTRLDTLEISYQSDIPKVNLHY